MKIVVVTTGHRPDDDRIYFKEIISLLAKYPQVNLVAPVGVGETYALRPGVVLHPLPRRCGALGRLRTALEAAIQAVRLKADVCHFHDLDFAVLVPFVRLFCRAKIIYDVHEAYPESMLISPKIPAGFRPAAARLVDWIEKGCARFCARIVTADLPTTASFAKTGVPATTLFNFPRQSIFEAAPADLAEFQNSVAGRRILIYQGTMERARGLFHMLDGMRRLKDALPEALLLLVGLKDDELRRQVEAQIQRDRSGDQVRIVPWVPHAEIAGYIALAEIGLVPLQPNPKFNKNIPIKIFEYMACGKPVLAANLPAIAPFIAASGAGVLYDSTDPQAFAREVQGMLNNPEGLAAMSCAGRTAVRERWNWGAMEKTLLSVYSGLEPT